LNLQSLGTFINIDLPRNPTRLKQRKGSVQRIGQKRTSVKILNLRYEDSIEDRVHEVLSERLEDIHKIFGQIPDVLEDVWIDIALGEQEKSSRNWIDLLKKPFDERYAKINQIEDWETCAMLLTG